jgi:alkylation response protein AidB-like acyl-CoA dehydrogenase
MQMAPEPVSEGGMSRVQLQWNEHQREIVRQYESFGRDQIAPRAEKCYTASEFDHESWQALADQGFWRIPVPVELGGYGQSWWDFVAALEGMASTAQDLGFLLSIVAHSGTIRGLVDFGTSEQRERYLEPLMSGAVGATAMTEANGGSDVARVRTSATRASGGGFELTGSKCHVTNAPIADFVLTLGRIPELGSRDITVFLVDTTNPGVSRGDAEQMFGNRTSPTGPLDMSAAEIEDAHVLGPEGDGLATIYSVIAMDRLLYGVIAAAFIEPMVWQALQRAQEREAFKTKLADHEYIQGRITELEVLAQTVRWSSYAALDKLISGDRFASLVCSVAKLTGCEALCQATQHLMTIFGHLGYMEGQLTRFAADALGTRIAGGTAEMQRKNIFNQLVANQPEVTTPALIG